MSAAEASLSARQLSTINSVNEWRIRPRTGSRVVTVLYGLIVGLPLGVLLTAGVFVLMSYRPIHVVFVVAALACAVLGPFLIVLLPLGLKAARNIELVLTPWELVLLDESGRPTRVVPRAGLSVWRATLPAAVTASDVPRFPQEIIVVAGPHSAMALGREWQRNDLVQLWKYLGVVPRSAGRLTRSELNARFPGVADTLAASARSAGIWFRVYLVCVVVLTVYVAAVAVTAM